jgi:ATP-dependent RNA helicase RhlE
VALLVRNVHQKDRYVNFADLRLAEPILRSLSEERYTIPTPIQAQAIPIVLEGRDVMGCAQTGTGKTAAFALPILHRLIARKQHDAKHQLRCLVLAPTRELALQIEESFRTYGRHVGIRTASIFGGVSQHGQTKSLAHGIDVLVATPGRLLDLMNQGHAKLGTVEFLVLDEADRMLDMGFINDIRKIVARVPAKRQTLMFSATMPTEIRTLAGTILRDPASVQVSPVGSTIEKVDQSVYHVERKNKPALLAHLIKNTAISRALVFTRTKHGADRVVRQLHQAGIKSDAIHGNKSQNARQRALANFKSGKTHILIASDVASRGIDVDDISHVINYDLTHEPETYVHRIGRTARAGASGHAISFCDTDERENLRLIERLIRRSIPVKQDHPKYAETEASRSHSVSHAHSRGHGHARPPARRSAHPSAHQIAKPQPAKSNPPARRQAPARPQPAKRLRHPLYQRGGSRYTTVHAKH